MNKGNIVGFQREKVTTMAWKDKKQFHFYQPSTKIVDYILLYIC